MNDILLSLSLAGVFFGAMLFRGIFGYLKNQKLSVDDIKFDWKWFLNGSLRPIALTLATGGLAAIVLVFLQLINLAGLEVVGLEQISLKNFELGLAIADIGAIGYALKEALLCFGLSDKQITQIRETVAETGADSDTGAIINIDKDGNIIASAETITKKTDKELLEEEGVVISDGYDLTNAGKGSAYNNTYPEPYRSAPKDTLVDPSTCYNRECVSYCAWKICEAVGSWLRRTGGMNAKDWVYRLPENGYNEVVTPRDGGLYVGVLTSGVYGHVVWFEGGDVISEYNYGYAGNYGVRAIVLSDYRWFEIKAPAPSPAPAPTPAKKSNEEIANEVIRGEWGNNPERQQRLEAAGYDYNAIQAIVNEKLGGGTPSSDGFSVGDTVVPIRLVDYNGTPLVQYDDTYTISELNGNRAVLTARGQVWAAMNTADIRKP